MSNFARGMVTGLLSGAGIWVLFTTVSAVAALPVEVAVQPAMYTTDREVEGRVCFRRPHHAGFVCVEVKQ